MADLFLFSCGGDFVLSLSEDTQSDVIEAFGSVSRCLGGLLNIDKTSLMAWSTVFALQSFG